MKTCTKCNQEKPLEDFWKHKKSSDGRQAWCKDCSRQRRISYYHENRERENELRDVWNDAYRAWYISLKDGKPCARCDKTFFHAAMHWHHLGNKTANVANLARHRASKKRVLSEIAECELLCAVCHAIETWQGEIT